MMLPLSSAEPLAPLRSADVIVAGAGVIGLAIAYELARLGHDVQVIDGRPDFGPASRAAGGMLAPLGEARDPGPFVRLGMASLDRYPDWTAELEAQSGVEVGFRRCGKLLLATGPDDVASLREREAWMRADGHRAAWLDGDALRSLEPALSPEVVGALHLPDDAQVDNTRLHQALMRALQVAGGRLSVGVRVRRILIDGGRVSGVELEDGRQLWAPQVVLAAGAWAPHVEGLPRPLPVRPVRGQMIQIGLDQPLIERLISTPSAYLIPRLRDGYPTLVVGASMEDAGFDEQTDPQTLQGLNDAAIGAVPALRDAPRIGAWAGLRPGTPDGLPVVGRDPDLEGLVHACGHFRNGILLAPITAELVCDELLDRSGEARRLLPHLTPERFTHPAPCTASTP
jgi:glycine oxidase